MSVKVSVPAVVCVQEALTAVTSTVFEAFPGITALSVVELPTNAADAT
jgi:hypothetical protein